ncbi:MAG: hypothetical protein JNL70_25040 [Saprospiraceae bacterium]|nr:hypothetical protein [Saprospiraceae bacterium]
MTRSEFDQCLQNKTFPPNGNILLKALFHDALGDWEAAHNIAQSREGTLLYDRLHAYLHRKEGDNWNANYWYRRAKTTMPAVSLDEEWHDLVNLFGNSH